MNRYNIYIRSALMLLLTTYILSGCQRRPLEEEVGSVAMIPFKIDWSQSGLDISAMHRATIRVFPHDGSPAYDFRLQENLTEVEMPLAIGKYSFVVFNETTDPEDWNNLLFKEVDTYDQFMVTTHKDIFRGLYTRANNILVLKTPEALAAWSIDEFEITKEMIIYTRAKTKGSQTKAEFISQEVLVLEKQLEKVSSIVPLPIVKTLNIVARVENLASAQKSSGAIIGATQGIRLRNSQPTAEKATHIFIMNGRQYDDPTNPKHGTIRAKILVFNTGYIDDLKCELAIDFLLNDGTLFNPEAFDITKEIKQSDINININVGFNAEGKPDDQPIVLPEGLGSGGDVIVDDWEEVIVPIE